MDFVRSCYRSSMRLYADRPEEITAGRWYFCPPGAKPIPYLHLFGSSNYDPDGRIDPPVGEVGRANHPWFNGKPNPRLTGQNWCGGGALWQEGSPFSLKGTPAVDSQGIPFCCGAKPAAGGGDGDGGECVQNWGFLQVAEGGDGDDGQAEQDVGFVQVGEGGDGDDGQAGQLGPALQVGEGGDGDDGQAGQGLAYLQVAEGGDGDDGEAPQGLGFCQVAEGGDGDDGQAGQLGPALQVAEGGDGDDGDAGQGIGFLQVAEGGDGDDGQGGQVTGFIQLAGGGDGDDGQVVQWGNAVQVAGGGDGDDGQAGQVTGFVQVAGGGDGDDGQAGQVPGFIQIAGGGDGDDGEAGQVTPITPGANCDAAATISLGVDYTFSLSAPGQHWFKFAGTGGTEYHLTYTINSGSGVNANMGDGACPFPLLRVSLMTSGCGSYTLGASGDVRVWLFPPLMGSLNYTINVNTGPCP